MAALALASSTFLAAAAASLFAFVALAELASLALAIISFSAASAAFIAAWRVAMHLALAVRQALSSTQTFSVYGSLNAPYETYLVTGLQIGTQGFGVHGSCRSCSRRSSMRLSWARTAALSAAKSTKYFS